MSVLGLIDQSKINYVPGGVQEQPTNFLDVVDATISATARNYNPISESLFTGIETNNRNKRYQELTSRDLYQDAFESSPDSKKLLERYKMQAGLDNEQVKAVDAFIDRLRQTDPNKFAGILKSEGISSLVKDKANAALKEQSKVIGGATTGQALTGQLVGGLAAGFVDPINLLTMPLGAGLAQGIIKTALIEAGVNVAAEVAATPFIASWQKQLGNEYGFSEFTENAAYAAGFGAIFGGGAKAISKGIDKLSMSNSALAAQIRTVVDDIETNEAFRHEERRMHLDESDPSKYNPEVDPSLHTRALEDADAAINEGRPIELRNPEEADAALKSIDTEKMPEAEAKIVEELQRKPAKPEPPMDQQTNKVLENPDSRAPTPEQVDEMVEFNESPEVIRAQKQEFEDQFTAPKVEGQDPAVAKAAQDELDAFEFYDEDGNASTIAGLKEEFADDQAYLSAINSCGLKVTK